MSLAEFSEGLTDAGLLRWAFADDTGWDHEADDAVAADRAAAGTSA